MNESIRPLVESREHEIFDYPVTAEESYRCRGRFLPAVVRATGERRDRCQVCGVALTQESRGELLRRVIDSKAPTVDAEAIESLLRAIPRLGFAAGVGQEGTGHRWDVLNHTAQAFQHVRRHTADLTNFRERPYGSLTRHQLLCFAAVLHDIAKPETRRVVYGRATFHGHEEIGAVLVPAALARFTAREGEIEHVRRLVRLHLRPGFLIAEGEPSTRAIERLRRDADGIQTDLRILAEADFYAKRGDFTSERDLARYRDRLRQILIDEEEMNMSWN